jgi:hypothetical protein
MPIDLVCMAVILGLAFANQIITLVGLSIP